MNSNELSLGDILSILPTDNDTISLSVRRECEYCSHAS